jgi:hypothetical protein
LPAQLKTFSTPFVSGGRVKIPSWINSVILVNVLTAFMSIG